MSTLRYHNPILLSQLQVVVDAGSAQALLARLSTLRSADAKTAGYLLSEKILVQCNSDFFSEAFLTIVPTCSKAYLMTFLKAVVVRYRQGMITFTDKIWGDYHQTLPTLIDCQKMLTTLLPIARRYEEVENLLNLFADDDVSSKINYLIPVATLPATYVLFKLSKHEDGNLVELKRICIALMRRGDKLAFTLVAIMQRYYGLQDIPGIFSFDVKTYQLSRLDENYENFCSIIRN